MRILDNFLFGKFLKDAYQKINNGNIWAGSFQDRYFLSAYQYNHFFHNDYELRVL